MSAGYVRQSAASIAAGLTITSAAHNNEYNALAMAFDATVGHTHDGTVGGGALIPPQALAALPIGGVGLLIASSPTSFINRSLVAGTNISITNPDGTSGNPVINCTVAGITVPGIGLLVSPNGTTTTNRILVAGTGIAITNPDGAAGNIRIDNTGFIQNPADILLMQVLI